MWGLWRTKRHWGRFSPSTSLSSVNHHSTNFSIIIITWGWDNRLINGRSAKCTQFDSTLLPRLPIKKSIPIHHSPIVLHLDTVQVQLTTDSSNKCASSIYKVEDSRWRDHIRTTVGVRVYLPAYTWLHIRVFFKWD
jgi:hypothetical protein